MKKLIAIAAGAVMALGVIGSAQAADEMVQIKGSDTLINLVQREAEVYMENYPDRNIAVTGGGSGTGIAAMLNGQCDIADASRKIKDKEMKMAEQKGLKPVEIVVANDGISVIVSDKNPVKQLSMKQLGAMYRGEITNWKDVGGADHEITLYGRQPNSGTQAFFKKKVLQGEYSQKMREMNGNSQIAEAVKHDAYGIGYIGVGYARNAKGVTVLKVGLEGGEFVSPLDTAAVLAGKYPIFRNLNQYVNGTPKGAVLDFINFELSPAGQKIVEEEGFFPIGTKEMAANKKALGL